jgi:FMN phosphatase YigB (HAD superfamily)
MSLAGREETTLDAIWMKLRDLLDLSPACGPQYELDAEREVLAPNAIVLERITQARAAGCRIVFVSDTYLPVEFVKGELRRHNAAAEGDGVYVSSALGRTKRSGALYREMLKAEKVTANAVHHYGDNPHSDVDVPRRLGIAATLLADAHLNEWERAILNCAPAPGETAARLAGSMRSFRLGASREFSAGSRAGSNVPWPGRGGMGRVGAGGCPAQRRAAALFCGPRRSLGLARGACPGAAIRRHRLPLSQNFAAVGPASCSRGDQP